MAPAPLTARPHAFESLLTRYVVGDVGDAAMSAVCDLLEDTPATPSERLAFARFFLDAMATDDDLVPMPRPEEIADVLQIARA